jgi:hypothetical protein
MFELVEHRQPFLTGKDWCSAAFNKKRLRYHNYMKTNKPKKSKLWGATPLLMSAHRRQSLQTSAPGRYSAMPFATDEHRTEWAPTTVWCWGPCYQRPDGNALSKCSTPCTLPLELARLHSAVESWACCATRTWKPGIGYSAEPARWWLARSEGRSTPLLSKGMW